MNRIFKSKHLNQQQVMNIITEYKSLQQSDKKDLSNEDLKNLCNKYNINSNDFQNIIHIYIKI